MLAFQGNLSPAIHPCLLHLKKLRLGVCGGPGGGCLGQSHIARSGARSTPLFCLLRGCQRNTESENEGVKAGVRRGYGNLEQGLCL